MLVCSQEGLMLFVIDWQASTGHAATVRLYKNDYFPTRFSVGADFTESDYDGYLSFPLRSWEGYFNLASGGYVEQPFGGSGGGTPNTVPQVVYGFYCNLNADHSKVLLAGRFDEPFPMPVSLGRSFIYNLNFIFAQPGA